MLSVLFITLSCSIHWSAANTLRTMTCHHSYQEAAEHHVGSRKWDLQTASAQVSADNPRFYLQVWTDAMRLPEPTKTRFCFPFHLRPAAARVDRAAPDRLALQLVNDISNSLVLQLNGMLSDMVWVWRGDTFLIREKALVTCWVSTACFQEVKSVLGYCFHTKCPKSLHNK